MKIKGVVLEEGVHRDTLPRVARVLATWSMTVVTNSDEILRLAKNDY